MKDLRERCTELRKLLDCDGNWQEHIEAFAREILDAREQELLDESYRAAHDASRFCKGDVPVGMFFTYERLAKITRKQAGIHALAASAKEE